MSEVDVHNRSRLSALLLHWPLSVGSLPRLVQMTYMAKRFVSVALLCATIAFGIAAIVDIKWVDSTELSSTSGEFHIGLYKVRERTRNDSDNADGQMTNIAATPLRRCGDFRRTAYDRPRHIGMPIWRIGA
jgi:hypothetical protein